MAIQHAIKFLKALDDKPELRESLYRCEGYDALFETLKVAG